MTKKMNNLKVLGKEKIANFEFTGIEGGFGENKRAMLVKDIAKIHGKELRQINQSIDMNRSHFKDGVDIVDLLNQSDGFRKFAKSQGLIGSNRTKHVYLLSERGYLKLLKIMDDDKAWDIYNEIVDNYFNMRAAIKENKPQIVEPSRLFIMQRNADTRRAQTILKALDIVQDDYSRGALEKELVKELTGQDVRVNIKKKDYSAEEVGKSLGLTANKVGRIANELGIKADGNKRSQNEYGRYVQSKSKYSDHQVPQWRYFRKGANAIKAEAKKHGMGKFKKN